MVKKKKKEVGELVNKLKSLCLKKCSYLLSKKNIIEENAYSLFKLFFKGFFDINYEISFLDIEKKVADSDLSADLQTDTIKFLHFIIHNLYSGRKINQKSLRFLIQKFSSLVESYAIKKKETTLIKKSAKSILGMPFIRKLFVRKGELISKNLKKKNNEKINSLSTREKIINQLSEASTDKVTKDKDSSTAFTLKKKINVTQDSEKKIKYESLKKNENEKLNLPEKDMFKESQSISELRPSFEHSGFDMSSTFMSNSDNDVNSAISNKVDSIHNKDTLKSKLISSKINSELYLEKNQEPKKVKTLGNKEEKLKNMNVSNLLSNNPVDWSTDLSVDALSTVQNTEKDNRLEKGQAYDTINNQESNDKSIKFEKSESTDLLPKKNTNNYSETNSFQNTEVDVKRNLSIKETSKNMQEPMPLNENNSFATNTNNVLESTNKDVESSDSLMQERAKNYNKSNSESMNIVNKNISRESEQIHKSQHISFDDKKIFNREQTNQESVNQERNAPDKDNQYKTNEYECSVFQNAKKDAELNSNKNLVDANSSYIKANALKSDSEKSDSTFNSSVNSKNIDYNSSDSSEDHITAEVNFDPKNNKSKVLEKENLPISSSLENLETSSFKEEKEESKVNFDPSTDIIIDLNADNIDESFFAGSSEKKDETKKLSNFKENKLEQKQNSFNDNFSEESSKVLEKIIDIKNSIKYLEKKWLK